MRQLIGSRVDAPGLLFSVGIDDDAVKGHLHGDDRRGDRRHMTALSPCDATSLAGHSDPVRSPATRDAVIDYAPKRTDDTLRHLKRIELA
jgi:hypothetical protein